MALTLKQRISKKVKTLMTQRNINRLGYLYDRWLDEKKYEDWGEYEKAMKKMVPAGKGIIFIKAHKRPFGLTVNLTGTINRKVQITVTSRNIGWKTL